MGYRNFMVNFISWKSQISFPQVVERGAGMDVHRDTLVVTVMGTGIITETKTFTTYTNDLRGLSGWLKSFCDHSFVNREYRCLLEACF